MKQQLARGLFWLERNSPRFFKWLRWHLCDREILAHYRWLRKQPRLEQRPPDWRPE